MSGLVVPYNDPSGSNLGYQLALFLSSFLRNSFLCWDRWNGDVTPTLDAALLCSSRAGSDLGRGADWFEELCQLYSF